MEAVPGSAGADRGGGRSFDACRGDPTVAAAVGAKLKELRAQLAEAQGAAAAGATALASKDAIKKLMKF